MKNKELRRTMLDSNCVYVQVCILFLPESDENECESILDQGKYNQDGQRGLRFP